MSNNSLKANEERQRQLEAELRDVRQQAQGMRTAGAQNSSGLKLGTVIWTFIWCVFMGITVGSIGIGAIFPSANLIAGPFVCPGGQMQTSSQVYNVSPVETVTTLTTYCVDGATGAKTEVGLFPMSLYAGTIYGVLLFFVILAGMLLVIRSASLSAWWASHSRGGYRYD